MSDQISTALVKQFHSNFILLAQQKGSRLRNAVRVEPINAEDGFYDQIGASDGADIVDRHGDTQYAITPHDRRKVTPIPWQWADLIDKQDKVRMLGDPQSTYLQAAVAAAGRRIDDHIIAAAFGTAYTGKTGGTPVTFPTAATNVVPVNLGGSAEGMTVAKLIRAKALLWAYDVDEDIPLHCAMTGAQFEDLLNEQKATSSDYASVKALVRGEINTFLGITFHRSERLLQTADPYDRCPMWAQDGILLALAEDVITKIDLLPQKRYTTQVYCQMDMGATRMEESKVIEILCTP